MDKSELSLTGEEVDLSKYVEDAGGIHGLRDIDKVRGWNNIEYGAGLSGKNTPATKLSMNKAFIPPGGVAAAHIHVDFDVMIFLLKGAVRHEFGPGCRKSVVHSAGDMSTSNQDCRMRCSIAQIANGSRRSSLAQTPRNGRISSHTTEIQSDIYSEC